MDAVVLHKYLAGFATLSLTAITTMVMWYLNKKIEVLEQQRQVQQLVRDKLAELDELDAQLRSLLSAIGDEVKGTPDTGDDAVGTDT